jgi:hypothetical protein
VSKFRFRGKFGDFAGTRVASDWTNLDAIERYLTI